jgi:glycosyl transferase family 1
VIVEIGPVPYVAQAYSGEALFFSSQSAKDQPEGVATLASLAELAGALARSDLELIVSHPNFSTPWGLRHVNRSVFSRRFVEGRSPLFRALGPELLRGPLRAPLVVIDHEDLPVINRDNLFLLDRCALWFKRELPVDHWRVFTKTAHPQLPTPRFRTNPRHAAWLAKLRPISLGLPLPTAHLLPLRPTEKRADVFYSGLVEGSSTVRARGLAELHALAADGVAVDIPGERLPPAEFYARCAAAWLVWSPEGLGWDCFRHYEAPACGAVPLINQPQVDRHQPLIHGEHAFYYDPEPGGLTRAVRAALADKAVLARIAAAGQAHVMAHHTPAALARYVVETARALKPEA